MPFSRPGEALETAVPGLLVTQHSGEGKANQYQLRGFQLDHGTDLAIDIDGMPLNMPTHGHGQGYADANFLIPELFSYVIGKKGPYYADEGDFSAAGAVHIRYKEELPDGLFSATAGSFDYGRLLGITSNKVEGGTLLSAAELGIYNGPWTVPDEVHKINGVMTWSQGTQENGIAFDAMAYANRWHASNQIPERAVTEGVISLWGNINPTDRGDTTRFSLSGRWSETDANSHSRIEAFAIHSTLDLYNDFDYYLSQPLLGDQFRQFDRRTILGLKAEHGWNYNFAGFPVETRIGVQSRYDDIRVGLQDTYDKMAFQTLTNDAVDEGNVGLWTDTHREMDTLAAHDGGRSRRLFRRQRRRHSEPVLGGLAYRSRRPHRASELSQQRQHDFSGLDLYRRHGIPGRSPPRSTAPNSPSCWGLGTRPNSSSTRARVSTPPTCAPPSPISIRPTAPRPPRFRCSSRRAASEVRPRTKSSMASTPPSPSGGSFLGKPVRRRHWHDLVLSSEPALRHRTRQSLLALHGCISTAI